MLTRRENLLIRPWQQRRFQSHRRKVNSALPAIDASAPAERGHVLCKLKKLQREEERVERIENDNVRLLQRMAAIMRTSRLDNHWLTTPPGSFLARIGIYAPPSYSTIRSEAETSEGQGSMAPLAGSGRKATCAACRLKRHQQQEQEKVTQRQSLENIPEVAAAEKPCLVESLPPVTKTKQKTANKKLRARHVVHPRPEVKSHEWTPVNNRVVLTRGHFKLSVNYPAHTGVVLERPGCTPAVLDTEFCSCAAKLPPCTA